MRRFCEKCGRSFDDESCSTQCPHRGIGFCAVCDCVICLCSPETAGKNWERSSANRETGKQAAEESPSPAQNILTETDTVEANHTMSMKDLEVLKASEGCRLSEQLLQGLLPGEKGSKGPR